MAISVPWEALKPNCASDVYIYGDILFCKISSNNFEAAVGSVIGLQFILSDDDHWNEQNFHQFARQKSVT